MSTNVWHFLLVSEGCQLFYNARKIIEVNGLVFTYYFKYR